MQPLRYLKSRPPLSQKAVRIYMAFLGVALCSIAVGIFKLSVLGTDPFTCFVSGFSVWTGVNYGNIYTILCVIMLLILLLIDRRKIGIATFFNIFCGGYIAQITMNLMGPLFNNAPIWLRILGMITGIVLTCFAASIYFTADLGVSTYDAISLIMGERTPIPFKFCRITTDLICVATGWLLMARDTIGIGTIITALFMGPLIEFFNVHFSRPFLFEREWSHMTMRPAAKDESKKTVSE